MRQKHTIVFFVFLSMVLLVTTSCSKKERDWIQTKEGYYFYGTIVKDKSIYSWNGETRGTVIHGKGDLTVYSGDGQYKNTAAINAYYGTISDKDWLETPEGKFIGEVKDNEPKGFGVLMNGNTVSIGKFNKGKLNGEAVVYVDDELRYRGEMSDGQYNGHGMELDHGKVHIGKWEDGKLTESSLSIAGEEVKRLWNRITFQNEKNQQQSAADEDTTQVENFVQGKEIFCDSLASQLSTFISSGVTKTIENRTNWLSLQPIRMFWQSFFTSKTKRMEGWMDALNNSGLSYIDLEEIINAQVSQYNKYNPEAQLHKVKLSPFTADQIIDNQTFKNIRDREISGWGDNLWFDIALSYLFYVPIFFILICFDADELIEEGGPIHFLPGALATTVSIVFFIISLFNGNIEQDISNGILQNYINYFENQGIINQLIQ